MGMVIVFVDGWVRCGMDRPRAAKCRGRKIKLSMCNYVNNRWGWRWGGGGGDELAVCLGH